MNSKTIIISSVILVLVASVLVSLRHSKKSGGLFSFFYADKKLNVPQVTHLLLSSSFAMNGLLYQAYLGYKIGWAAIILQVMWCLSFILLSSKAGRIKKLTANGTLHYAITNNFGRTAGKLAAISTIIGFTIQVGWELIVGVSVFGNNFTDNPNYSWGLILIITGVCAIYTMAGGLKASVFANTLQNWVAIVALITITLFLVVNYHPISLERPWDGGSVTRLISELGVSFFITNALFSIFWQFVDFSAWQNLASADGGGAEAKSSLYWSSLWIFFFPGAVGTIIGMYLRGTAAASDPDNLFPYIISLISQYPLLLVITVAGCVAAMLSTIDGLLLATSQAALWDLFFTKQVYDSTSNENENSQKKLTNYGRIFILLFGFIGSALIYYITIRFQIDIFSLVYLVVIAQMVLIPVVLLLLFSKTETTFKYGGISIGTGLIVGLATVSYGISTNDQNLLAWSPTISLAFSCIPQIFNLAKRSK